MVKQNHPLREWRGNQVPKKTLSSLAQDLKVSASHLSEIESGNNEPSLDLAARLHDITGIGMKEFVKPKESAA